MSSDTSSASARFGASSLMPVRHPCLSAPSLIPVRYPCISAICLTMPVRHPYLSAPSLISFRYPCISAISLTMPVRHPCLSAPSLISLRYPCNSATSLMPFGHACVSAVSGFKMGRTDGERKGREGDSKSQSPSSRIHSIPCASPSVQPLHTSQPLPPALTTGHPAARVKARQNFKLTGLMPRA